MLLLNEKEIKSVVSMKDIVEADKKAFQMIAAGTVEVPLRAAIKAPAHEGTFLFMPSYAASEEAAAVKIISVFPHNPEMGLEACPAQVLLLDGKTGYISAMLDGSTVTRMRTGAASGAAFDILGKKECRVGALIGTGGQAPEQLEAMLCVRKLEKVWVYSRKREKLEAFCEKMQKELGCYGAEILPANSADEAVEDADLVITVTTSSVPVFDGAKIKPGCTISAVGTYEPEKHELDPAVLPRASKIICDYKDAVLSESGDLLIPLADGIIKDEDIQGSLGDVIDGRIAGRENDDEIIVFESVGVASQDLVAAWMIYEKALAAGAGTEWQ
ncbi:MAG: ornithine cyclodeaminase family protein [Clostridiales bacterium]|nr:ornithine cyclodeaminase family protein [Clostridiales bacterium]